MSTHPLQLRRFAGPDPGKGNPATKDGGYEATPTERVPFGSDAQLVSSFIDDSTSGHMSGQGDHVIAIDIDIPCHLIETSPGKHHLIVEKPMPWKTYRALLIALEQAGVIEPGYLEASLARRASYLRIHPTTPLTIERPDEAEKF